MFIPIHYSYKYKNYPYSPKATRYSRLLGGLTAWPMYLVYGFFWISIVYGVLCAIGIDEDPSMVIALFSLILMVILIKKIKERVSKRIDAIAARDLIK